MDIQKRHQDNVCNIELSGMFRFADYKKFRWCEDFPKEMNSNIMVIDFSKVSYIDSSSLGMLMLMMERCDAIGVVLKIVGLNGQPKKIIELCQLEDQLLKH